MSSDSIETRTRILQAAVRTLEESGGRGVRMGDIAKETGISRQAVMPWQAPFGFFAASRGC